MVGCKADSATRASSQFDQAATPAAPGGNAPNLPASVPDHRPLIVCFGDSLTAGYGADDGQAYPDFLQKDLDADGYRYRVVNEGISGNTTKDGVDRLAEVEAMKPAVVVLEFGGNDGLRGFKVQTTRTNLARMIEGLQASGAKVVLAGITLPPDYGPDYVNSFTANYSVLAKKYNVPLLPFLLKDVYGVPGMMQADRTHATDQGNQVVAKNVLPLVEPLLKK
jgi:acyl-CoA thioesterase-1